MKITKVTYQKTYSIGPYLTDRVGFEAEPEGNPRDSAAEMLSFLEEIADEWHKKAHPHLYQDGPNIQTTPDAPYTIPEPLIINIQHEKIQIAIENAQSIEELKKIKEDNPVMTVNTLKLYNNRRHELTNESNTSFTNGLE